MGIRGRAYGAVADGGRCGRVNGGVRPLTVIQPCLVASYVAFGACRDGNSRGVLVQIDRRQLLAVFEPWGTRHWGASVSRWPRG
jgi:hypothetical protein